MKNRFINSILILLLAMSIFYIQSTGYAAGEVEGTVVSPKIGSPYVLGYGDKLEVKFKIAGEVSDFKLNLTRVYEENGELKYMNVELDIENVNQSTQGKNFIYTLTTTIPDGLVEGMYTIRLLYKTVDGEEHVFVEPDSVWIQDRTLDKLTLLQVSDVHIGFEYPSNQRLMTALLMSQLLQPEPDLIVATGDVTDRASSKEARTLREILTEFSIGKPKLFAPGNHDARTTAYDTYIGSRNYYRVVGDRFLFIALDTGKNGRIDYKTFKWMEQVIKENSELVKIVYFHHPILSSRDAVGFQTYTGEVDPSWVYPSWGDNMSLTQQVVDLFMEYNVALVLSGHIHSDRTIILSDEDSTTYFVTTTTLGASRPEYNGLRLITIFSNGSVKLHNMPPWGRFDKVPNSIPIEYIEKFGRALSYRARTQYPIFRVIESDDGSSLSVSLSIMSWLSLRGTLLFGITTDMNVDGYNLYISKQVNSSAALSDKDRFGNTNYFLVNTSLNGGGRIIFTISTFEDTDPPNLELAYMIPSEPAPNVPIALYFDATDSGWGVYKIMVSVSIMRDGDVEVKMMEAIYTGTLYVLSLDGYEEGTVINLKPSALDPGLNFVNGSEINIEIPVQKEPVYIPNIEVMDVAISNDVIDLGDSVELTISLENVGNGTGEYTVTVKINGELYNSTSVTLDAGQSFTLTLTLTPDSPGTYTVEVDGKTLQFRVNEPVEAPQQPPEEGEKPAEEPGVEKPDTSIYLIMVVVLIVIVSLIAFIFVRRKS